MLRDGTVISRCTSSNCKKRESVSEVGSGRGISSDYSNHSKNVVRLTYTNDLSIFIFLPIISFIQKKENEILPNPSFSDKNTGRVSIWALRGLVRRVVEGGYTMNEKCYTCHKNTVTLDKFNTHTPLV